MLLRLKGSDFQQRGLVSHYQLLPRPGIPPPSWSICPLARVLCPLECVQKRWRTNQTLSPLPTVKRGHKYLTGDASWSPLVRTTRGQQKACYMGGQGQPPEKEACASLLSPPVSLGTRQQDVQTVTSLRPLLCTLYSLTTCKRSAGPKTVWTELK